MQKKIIALAVAGLMSGAAFAQSNVTIYGVVDMGLVSDGKAFGTAANTPRAQTTTRLESGVWSGSRLGFKGEESLGGGLTVSFVMETGYQADSNTSWNGTAAPQFGTGGNNFMGRQSTLAVSGGFGTLQMGRQYAPVFTTILAPMDPFGAGTAGQLENLMNAGVTRGNPRFNNSVAYVTPAMSGFTGVAGYSLGEQTGTTREGSGWTFGGNYANGPLNVGAYSTRVAGNSGSASFKVGDGLTLNTVGVSYAFGMVKPSFIYQTHKAGINSLTGGAWTIDAAEWMLGATIAVGGAGTVAVSYTNVNDKLVANNDASQTAVGYFHALSKRTTLYTAYSTINNKNAAAFTVGNSTGVGTGQAGFNLGLRHTF